jgi:alkylation response protein AidB-like acyl-CoA dehydrogenase
MRTAAAPLREPTEAVAPAPQGGSGLLGRVRNIVDTDLAPLAPRIDGEGLYPEAILRRLGEAGAFAAHVEPAGAAAGGFAAAIDAMAIAGETCLSTAFCMWCQDALAWYLVNAENRAPRAALGAAVAAGRALGGTGLSNPMKCFFGIEPMRLKGRRVAGGYALSGSLPWVSNLGADHYFGAVFELEDEPGHRVMAVIDCSQDGVALNDATRFLALDGTRTVAVRFRRAFIPDTMILADPVDDFIRRIRAGFILLQAGMGIGLVRGCIGLMRSAEGPLGHVNRFLDDRPDDLAGELAALHGRVARLAATPLEDSGDYWRAVVEARLEASTLSLRASQAAMLHVGAAGYVAGAAAQRRLRESYFVAIVTPAVKQLRKMLAEMPA